MSMTVIAPTITISNPSDVTHTLYSDDDITWTVNQYTANYTLYLDNVIVTEGCRGKRIGEGIFQYLEKLATEEEAELLVLDVFTANKQAQKFYHRLGYHIEGFHFVKKMK